MIQYIESDIRDSDKNRIYLGGLNKLKVLQTDWATSKIIDIFPPMNERWIWVERTVKRLVW